MAMKSVDEQPHLLVKNASSAGVNEMMVCQARALIREIWPDEFGPIAATRRPTKKPAPPVEEESTSAREEAVYLMARGMLLEMLGGASPRPRLTLIRGGKGTRHG